MGNQRTSSSAPPYAKLSLGSRLVAMVVVLLGNVEGAKHACETMAMLTIPRIVRNDDEGSRRPACKILPQPRPKKTLNVWLTVQDTDT